MLDRAQKHSRVFAALLALALVFALLLCAAAVTLRAHHDCAGEDCPVCCVICSCEALLRAVRLTGSGLLFLAAALFACALFFLAGAAGPDRLTLVTMKVKLTE